MAKVPPRLLGVLLLAGAGGSTMVHRSVYEAARYGPAQVAEFGLALATFVLASVGTLLVIHGAGLFERAEQDDRPGSGAAPADPSSRTRR